MLGLRGKEKLEQLPCEQFIQDFEFSRAFLTTVSHGIKMENPVKIAHKAFVPIQFSL